MKVRVEYWVFEWSGKMTAEDIKEFEPQLEVLIRERKHKPIGILADLSQMHGAELKGPLGRVALPAKAHRPHRAHGRRRRGQVGRDHGDADRGAAVLEAETRYFETSEMLRAWEWVRTAKHAEDMPVRQISAGTGIWKDYHPEYMDL